jgi:hypothetical protein
LQRARRTTASTPQSSLDRTGSGREMRDVATDCILLIANREAQRIKSSDPGNGDDDGTMHPSRTRCRRVFDFRLSAPSSFFN